MSRKKKEKIEGSQTNVCIYACNVVVMRLCVDTIVSS